MDEKELDELFAPLLEDTEAEAEEVFQIDQNYKVYPEYQDSDGFVFISENRRIPNFDHQTSIVGESDAQYIVFEMDRYYNGIDLSEKNIQIHYERPDGEGDNSPPVNVMVSDNKIRFGWIIPASATEVTGKLKVMPFVYGNSSVTGSELYMMKSLYVEYTIHIGLSISGGIKKNDDWYNQFLLKMLEYVGEAKESRDEIRDIHVHIIDLVSNIQEIDYTVSEIVKYRDESKVSENNAKMYADEARDLLSSAKQGGFIPSGTLTFENLPQNPKTGAMYNISNDFTTDSRFIEGSGIKYKKGTNIYFTASGMWDVLEGVPYTKEDLGLGKVENKTSKEILGELTKEGVVGALGYTPIKEAPTIVEMVGSTETSDGASGIVPKPTKGKNNRYLSSDGTWKTVEVPDIPEIPDIDSHEVNFIEAIKRENISLGDTISEVFGKIKKWNSDLHNVAFSGNYYELNNLPSIESLGGVEKAQVFYTTTSKEDALNKINNPNLLFSKSVARPYCIIFVDSVGDSPLGGGVTCIFGYIYTNSDYGAQIAIKYPISKQRFRIRSLNNNVWSDWAYIYDSANKPTLAELGAASTRDLTSHYKYWTWESNVFNSPGWMRVAKTNYSCTMSIKRGYHVDWAEDHKVELINIYRVCEIKSIYDRTYNTNFFAIKKIRQVLASDGTIYTDIYYDSSHGSNGVGITLTDARSAYGNSDMVLDTPEIVPETTEGETILASMDFEENSWVGEPAVVRYDVPRPESNDVFTFNGPFWIIARRIGNTINLNINIGGKMAAVTNMTELATLPEEYYPVESVIHNYITQNGTPMILQITAGGKVLLYNNVNEVNDWLCRQSITYFVD